MHPRADVTDVVPLSVCCHLYFFLSAAVSALLLRTVFSTLQLRLSYSDNFTTAGGSAKLKTRRHEEKLSLVNRIFGLNLSYVDDVVRRLEFGEGISDFKRLNS